MKGGHLASGLGLPSRNQRGFRNVMGPVIAGIRGDRERQPEHQCQEGSNSVFHPREHSDPRVPEKSQSGDFRVKGRNAALVTRLKHPHLGYVNKGDSMELAGKLLVAMPGMGDPRFEKSVVFLCAHSEDGAMGLIVNKPSPDLTMDDLLEQLNIPKSEGSGGIRVHFGGPVEHGRGFVLHSADYTSKEATLNVDSQFRMTATQDVLEAISKGGGPEDSMVMLGYAGWGPGQLENEIVQNGWLIADAQPELVFSRDAGMKWGAALKTLGVDPVSLSSVGGRA